MNKMLMKRVHGGSNAIAISASSIEAARRRMNNVPAPDLLPKIDNHGDRSSKPCIRVNGPIVVGAGPSGLATGACLKEQGVPFIVIEKADCLGSLWKKRTYDRLMLHLPKQFCQLPELAFPEELPDYPTKDQFIDYLELYAKTFEINPQFNECVQAARFDQTSELWKVTTNQAEYVCRWLVVATGENAESFIPAIDGLGQFKGDLIHASEYKSGENFRGKRVLVIGCGMSGREISLDLSNHHASPSMVCRRLVAPGFPREMLGKSTSELDVMNLMMSWSIEGELRALDFDVFEKIRSGGIKVVPGIKAINDHEVELVNGEKLVIDAVVLATGYRSNVSSWLQERDFFLENGYPKVRFPHGWKGYAGLYAAGFTMRGLYGASHDAMEIANDISQVWKQEPKQKKQRITA